ncbi:MAG: hypothetical protein ACPGVE_01870 [Flavobacteriales bacterium]
MGYFIALVLFALSLWGTKKITGEQKPVAKLKNHYELVLPRLLLFVAVFYNAIHLQYIYNILQGHKEKSFILYLFVLLGALTVVLTLIKPAFRYMEKLVLKHLVCLVGIAFFLALLTIVILPIRNETKTVDGLRHLSYSMFALAYLLFFLVSARRELYFRIKNFKPRPCDSKCRNDVIKRSNLITRKALIVSLCLSLMLYVIANVLNVNTHLRDLDVMSPLTYVIIGLSGLASIVIVINWLAYAKLKNFPLLAIVVLCIAGYNYSHTSESHSLDPHDAHISYNQRDSLKTYIRTWLTEKKDRIECYDDVGKKYPILFFNAEGGGSRGLIHTGLVHNAILEQYPNYFEHIILMTGASGGQNGNSIFFASGGKTTLGTKQAKAFFNNDFASSSLISLLGRDLIAMKKGRGHILINQWDSVFNLTYPSQQRQLSEPLYNFYYDASGNLVSPLPPLLLSSATSVQDGRHHYHSPFAFKDSNALFFGDKDIHSHCKHWNNKKGYTIKQSMMLNSAFPVLSPIMRTSPHNQYVDAGLFESNGFLATFKFVESLKTVAEEMKLSEKIKFVGVWAKNSPNEGPPSESRSQIGGLFTSTTILKSRDGHYLNFKQAYSQLMNPLFEYNLFDETGFLVDNKIIVPVGRKFSDTAHYAIVEKINRDSLITQSLVNCLKLECYDIDHPDDEKLIISP